MNMVAAGPLRRLFALIAVVPLTLALALLVNGEVSLGMGTALAAPAPCTASSGTAFFASAGHGAEFDEGDTWQHGTFTFIESANSMRVREEISGDLVGRFPRGFFRGDQATITFDRTIRITAIFWWDNDPKPGQAGWSVNGIAGPTTGNQAGRCTGVNLTTDSLTIDAGGDSGGIDLWFVELATSTVPSPSTTGAQTPLVEAPTPQPTGSVAAVIGRPIGAVAGGGGGAAVTLPPTDTDEPGNAGGAPGLPLILVGLILMGVASVLVYRGRPRLQRD